MVFNPKQKRKYCLPHGLCKQGTGLRMVDGGWWMAGGWRMANGRWLMTCLNNNLKLSVDYLQTCPIKIHILSHEVLNIRKHTKFSKKKN